MRPRARKPRPAISSQGASEFDQLISALGEGEAPVAEVLGKSKAAINNIRRGLASPGPALREAIQLLAAKHGRSIPVDSWKNSIERSYLAGVAERIDALAPERVEVA